MQLFHEMKQKFPTVPDNIVNECATENCHNREKCIAALEKELISHPNTAQSYPSQVSLLSIFIFNRHYRHRSHINEAIHNLIYEVHIHYMYDINKYVFYTYILGY